MNLFGMSVRFIRRIAVMNVTGKWGYVRKKVNKSGIRMGSPLLLLCYGRVVISICHTKIMGNTDQLQIFNLHSFINMQFQLQAKKFCFILV